MTVLTVTAYEVRREQVHKTRCIFFLLRIKAQTEDFVAIPENSLPMWMAGKRCDMYKGPCACGAWHKPGDIEQMLGYHMEKLGYFS